MTNIVEPSKSGRIHHNPVINAGRLLIAPNDDGAPSWISRLAVFPLVFIPWLIVYEWIVYRGPGRGAFQTYMPGEWNWPIWQWMELFYVSPYLLVTLAPLAAPTNRVLRRFVISGLIATVIVNVVFVTVPAIAPPRPFEPHGMLGKMMVIDRDMDRNNGTAAFPSFHVIWAFMGAAVFARAHSRRVFKAAWWIWAVMVSASCVLTGMHSVIDILAGFGVFLGAYNYEWVVDQVAEGMKRSRQGSNL